MRTVRGSADEVAAPFRLEVGSLGSTRELERIELRGRLIAPSTART
jgi:hypothetical protein